MTKIQTYTGSIYLIINKLNNKKYVGQTVQNPEDRFRHHTYDAFNDKRRGCPKLDNAIKKYGKDSFKILTLKMFACSDYETLHKQLDYWETWYINYYNSVDKGYNCTFGGQKNKKLSEETRQKLIKSHTGKKQSKETIQRRMETFSKIGHIEKFKKPVLQFDLKGNFIKEWESVSEAAYALSGNKNSHIRDVADGKRNH